MIVFIVSLPFITCDEVDINSSLTSKSKTTNVESLVNKIDKELNSTSLAFNDTKNNTLSNVSEVFIPSFAVGRTSNGILFINASFGTPAQIQEMIIDTTKRYSWILSGANDIQCNKLASGCLSGSLYYPEESTTSLQLLNNTEKLTLDFFDQTIIKALPFLDNVNFTSVNTYDYFNTTSNNSIRTEQDETVELNERLTIESNWLSIKNTTFLVADDDGTITTALGLAGGNNSGNDLNDILGVSDGYDSFVFLNKLKNSNIISTTSYSLWLGNVTSQNATNAFTDSYVEPHSARSGEVGKLIFGGIDPSLFKGPFYQFNLLPYIDGTTNQSVKGYPILAMGPIYMSASNGRSINVTSEEFKEPVLLDSSDPSIYLPMNSIIQVAIQLGATYVENFRKWLVPCNVSDLDAHIDFTFDGLRIKVSVSDLLGSTFFDSSTNSTIHFTDGSEACSLRLYNSDDIGYNRLGSTFLRNAYIAVDTGKGVIAIAKARALSVNTNATTTVKSANYSSGIVSTITEIRSIVPITEGGTIPYATPRTDTDDNTLSIVINETSAKIPAQFTGYIYSNGIISGFGRSFFDTNRPKTTTSKKISTVNLTVDSSGLPYANATTTATSNHAIRIHDFQDVHQLDFSCFFSIFFAILAVMLPLL